MAASVDDTAFAYLISEELTDADEDLILLEHALRVKVPRVLCARLDTSSLTDSDRLNLFRFSHDQVYNGHKRTHALKYQSVVTTNGLIANMFGQMEGRRHDSALLTESNLMEDLQMLPDHSSGDTFRLNGDTAYPLRLQLQGPFKGANLTEDQRLFNKKMSSVRECVEWAFGKVVSLFAFVDFKKNQKLYLQSVGKTYKVAVLMTNCHTCLCGSQNSDYFGVRPPRLEEYLA
ncbi:uncharacterized protein LOC119739165 isoform X1 [Patiria miniata]|uniref:DDE Tnp4 domain-containing protein n=1 Tax=Patiria miniata TaxID=46514 RepID=A0A914B0K5_PATMI|nr:uncharacterized protein LOC119739165 isoform X1 [Patiria miniata]